MVAKNNKRRGKKGGRKNARRSYKANPSRSIVPTKRFTKLTYDWGTQAITTTTTAMGAYTCRMNSCYDPDYAVGGGQPRGFDQMAALYTNYRVHGVKIVCHIQNLTPGTQSIVAITARTTTPPPADVKELLEQPKVRKCFFTSEKACTLSGYFPLHYYLGQTKKVFNAEVSNTAGVGADPVQGLYGHVNFINIDELTSTSHSLRLSATYYVEFFKPQILGAS